MIGWADNQCTAHPELNLLYPIPKEGKRAWGAICLPVVRGGQHGLYIQLKHKDGSRLTDDQADWLEALSRQGYHAVMCRGWEKAAQVIMDYLKCTKERGRQE